MSSGELNKLWGTATFLELLIMTFLDLLKSTKLDVADPDLWSEEGGDKLTNKQWQTFWNIS